MRTEDGHIIQKCLEGDAAAFGLLVDKYKGSVYGLAYAKLGDFHDGQDMTQEVFLKAYQKLRTLKRWDKFLSWLYAITSNLASSARENARLWEVHKGQQIAAFKHRAIVESVAFSPNGKILACVDDTCIRLWDTQRKKKIAVLGKLPPREITTFWDRLYARFISIEPSRDYPDPYVSTIQSVVFSRDGKLPASGGFDNIVRVWDVAKRREIFIREPGEKERSSIYAVAFSPDGKILVSAGSENIHLWDVAEHKLIGTLNEVKYVKTLAFSPDGRFLAAGVRANIRVWDMETLAEVATLEGCLGAVKTFAFSGDGKTLVAGSWDSAIRVWDTNRLGSD